MSLYERIRALRRGPGSARTQRWISLGTLVILLVATPIAFTRLPETGDIGWPFLAVLALFGVPVSIALNGLEFMTIGRTVGVSVSMSLGIKVAIQGTAANLLPVPGAMLLRGHYLTAAGVPLRQASSAIAATGAVWLGVSLTATGAMLLSHQVVAAWTAVAVGLLLVLVAGIGVRHFAVAVPSRSLMRLISVELAMVATQALRYWLAFHAVAVDVSPAQAVALAAASPVAAAVGFVPGGLGLREAVASLIAALLGLSAAAGLVGAFVDRLADLVILVPLAIGLVVWGKEGSRMSVHHSSD